MEENSAPLSLSPEKVAYWYFRLNGFLQIENFIVHPRTRGGARTDADLLSVRFPHRVERLFDSPDEPMADDDSGLRLSTTVIDVAIIEVKSSRCKLNGPWTDPEKENFHRVLAAIGCVPREEIRESADALYRSGIHELSPHIRVRLIAVGSKRCPNLTHDYPEVPQILWRDVGYFMWKRFRRYRHQKRDTQGWDDVGRRLKSLAGEKDNREGFVDALFQRMGVNAGEIFDDRIPDFRRKRPIK